LDEIRRYALSLPDVKEGPPVPAARRIAAFKVDGTGFLGIEKGEKTITVSLGEAEQSWRHRAPRALVAQYAGSK
jgi:hypothetical protein